MNDQADLHQDIGGLKVMTRELSQQMRDFRDHSDEQHKALDKSFKAHQTCVRKHIADLSSDVVGLKTRWKLLAWIITGVATAGSLAGSLWPIIFGG